MKIDSRWGMRGSYSYLYLFGNLIQKQFHRSFHMNPCPIKKNHEIYQFYFFNNMDKLKIWNKRRSLSTKLYLRLVLKRLKRKEGILPLFILIERHNYFQKLYMVHLNCIKKLLKKTLWFTTKVQPFWI
jgi:hypothetical protein